MVAADARTDSGSRRRTGDAVLRCTACAARRKWRRRGRRAAKRKIVCAPNFRVLDQIRQRQIMEGDQVRRDIFNDGGTNQTF